MLGLHSDLVSCQWLKKNLSNPDLLVVDASQIPLGDTNKRNMIQGAIHFDFSNVICDASSGLPNTMPNEDKFAQEVSKLGIKMTDTIVVYDDKGIYSSPRVWWMFKTMGFKNVAVLDGGLPMWLELDYPITNHFADKTKSSFSATYQSDLICGKDKVKDCIKDSNTKLLDARSNSRFTGTEKETRPKLRSGHIPSSINLHFRSLVPKYTLLPQEDLTKIFQQIVPDLNEQIVFTCGSGVTACILALGATLCGYKNLCVYDGSWTEWGADESLDIEVG